MNNSNEMSMKSFVVILLAFLGFQVATAQLPDGTLCPSEFFQILGDNLDTEAAMEFDTSKVSVSAIISIYIHVVNDVNGENAGITEVYSEQVIHTINEHFNRVGLTFQLGNMDTVKEYPYTSVLIKSIDEELLTKYAKAQSINLFLVDSIYFESMSCYGYTYFPNNTERNNIYLRKDYFSYKPLLTQLGHFFGLLSTYDVGLALEFVDGSNCKYSGDLICDTYADRGTLGAVDDKCEYSGITLDPHGEYYAPSVANFMTNGPFECRCYFTNDQLRRMHYYLKNYRNYLR
jgi:hypothetical protein